MSDTNGHGKGDVLALRPGLEDVMDRQKTVLRQLEAPMTRETYLRWKADVVRAGVGRISDGLRALLADPDLAPLLEIYVVADRHVDPTVAEEFRRLLHESLAMEFARALEDLSRTSHELIPGMGIAGGAMAGGRYGGANIR